MPTNTSKKPNTFTSLERVYRAVKRRRVSGATSDEVERLLGLSHQNVSARLNELYNTGVLEVTGLTRTTRHGRPANVYFVVPPQNLVQYVEG